MLNGQIALVTGAIRGIGAAIARELGKQGAVVIGTATSASGAEQISQALQQDQIKGMGMALDVNDAAQIDQLLKAVAEQFGDVNILVNNAGITRDTLLMRMKDEDWDAVLDTNLKGAFHMIRHCAPLFIRARGGRIINISSVSGLMGNAGQANYSASKAGLIGLTKSVARELAPRGVTCNAIAPGFILTEMTSKLPEDVKSDWISKIPLRRGGLPEDVANVALFLASDLSSYVTGQTIHVCGGMAV